METGKGRPPPEAVRCARCGEVIGVYEPLLLAVGGVPRKTSRAAEPELIEASAARCYHLACQAEAPITAFPMDTVLD